MKWRLGLTPACPPFSTAGMLVCRTRTRSRGGKHYFAFRLVRSQRVGNKVRQRTLLDLGAHFPSQRDHWHSLRKRVERILDPQPALLPIEAPLRSRPKPSAAPGACCGTGSATPLPRRVPTEIMRPPTTEHLHFERNAPSWLAQQRKFAYVS